jgi:uncharacterized membrane protein
VAQTIKTRLATDWLRMTSLVFALLGVLDASYLSYIKLAHVAALCRGVGDCESVNSSVYSQVYGVPVALLGLGAYLAMAALLALEPRLPILQEYGPLAVFGLALTGTLYSAYLTYVELFVIHAVCPYCVASALLIVGLLVLAVIRLVQGPLGGLAER